MFRFYISMLSAEWFKKINIMNNKVKVTNLVLNAIDEFNSGLALEDQLKKDLNEILFDRSGKLDSMGFVNLSTAIEMKLETEFGLTISLFGQQFDASVRDPLKTVGSLIEYLTWILNNNQKT